MIQKEVILQNPSGLHARPASEFVREAARHACDIRIIKGDKVLNGKSIMALLSAGISKGDAVTLQAEGPGEAEALDSLTRLLSSLEAESQTP